MSARPLRGNGPLTTAIKELQEGNRQNALQRSAGISIDSHPLGSNVRVKTNGGAQRRAASSIPRYV